jgi:hypothetical protein
MKKLWIILDSKKTKTKEDNKFTEIKLGIRKSVVKMLMMRENYEEIILKYINIINNANYQKLITRPLIGKKKIVFPFKFNF